MIDFPEKDSAMPVGAETLHAVGAGCHGID